MRIIGGSFGMRIHGTRPGHYFPEELANVYARQEHQRHFAWLTCLLGMVILVPIGALLFGPIGFIAALALCVLGSFYGRHRYYVDMQFNDGALLTLETTRRQADQLVQLK